LKLENFTTLYCVARFCLGPYTESFLSELGLGVEAHCINRQESKTGSCAQFKPDRSNRGAAFHTSNSFSNKINFLFSAHHDFDKLLVLNKLEEIIINNKERSQYFKNFYDRNL
jgi:hypothetical protein